MVMAGLQSFSSSRMERQTRNIILSKTSISQLNSDLTCPGGVDVGVEQWGDELHLGRSRGEVVLEDDLTFVEPALPGSSLLPRDPKPAELNRQSVSSRARRRSTYSHSMRFIVPSWFFMGRAMNPKG